MIDFLLKSAEELQNKLNAEKIKELEKYPPEKIIRDFIHKSAERISAEDAAVHLIKKGYADILVKEISDLDPGSLTVAVAAELVKAGYAARVSEYPEIFLQGRPRDGDYGRDLKWRVAVELAHDPRPQEIMDNMHSYAPLVYGNEIAESFMGIGMMYTVAENLNRFKDGSLDIPIAGELTDAGYAGEVSEHRKVFDAEPDDMEYLVRNGYGAFLKNKRGEGEYFKEAA